MMLVKRLRGGRLSGNLRFDSQPDEIRLNWFERYGEMEWPSVQSQLIRREIENGRSTEIYEAI